jgi:acyl-CoA thioesterase-1
MAVKVSRRSFVLILLLLAAAVGLFLLPGPPDAVLNSPRPNERIVMLGDSMTSGIGASKGRELPVLVGELIGRPVANAGFPGDTTEGALNRLSGALQGNPGTVIVFLGGNDRIQGKSTKQIAANLDQIIERCHAGGAMVALVGFRINPGDGYVEMFEDLAKNKSCLLIPNVFSGVFLNPKMKHDSIHPNDEGYALIASRIAERLKPYLELENQ